MASALARQATGDWGASRGLEQPAGDSSTLSIGEKKKGNMRERRKIKEFVYSCTFTAMASSDSIGINGFSMVFQILRAMVNDGLDVPLNLKNAFRINLRQNTNFLHTT